MAEHDGADSTSIDHDATEAAARLRLDVARLEKTVTQLRYALDHRPPSDHVVGMIMLMGSCDEQAAWALLAKVSQNTNRKVRDVAALVTAQVASGQGLPLDLIAALSDVLPPRAATVQQLTQDRRVFPTPAEVLRPHLMGQV